MLVVVGRDSGVAGQGERDRLRALAHLLGIADSVYLRPAVAYARMPKSFLSHPGQGEEFSQQMLSLLNNAPAAREMGWTAAAHSRKFSWEQAAKETLAVYQEALSPKVLSTTG